MRLGVYCRVSTDKLDQLNSLETQKMFFEEFAEKNNHTLVKIYADEHVIIGTSGENLVKSRGLALVPISFLLRDKSKSFKSLKIINERL